MKKRFYGYRSFEPTYETMKEMRKRGVDIITLMVSNNGNFMGQPYTRFQPTWIWDHVYDFALFDRMIQETLEAVPDAKLNLVLDLNPPTWWYRRTYLYDVFLEFGRTAASPVYREAVMDYLQALLTHAVETFPGRFCTICVMGGMTTEWFDFSRGTESPCRRDAWEQYCRKHNLPLCDIPTFEERYSGIPETNGLLRTPETHKKALDYWKFNSELSFETMELFLNKAREVLPPEVGVAITYGYIFELFMPSSRASWAQLEYEKLFDLPSVDAALSPISYGTEERGMGGSPMAMIPLQTLKTRGKFVINSIDTTTWTSHFPETPHGKSVQIMGRKIEWKNAAEARAGIRREMCYNLIHGCATWQFDMWGGWYDDPRVADAIGECRAIWDREANQDHPENCQVCLVCDPENMYYINDDKPEANDFINPIRRAMARAGAMYTTASYGDLRKMNLDNYRLIVLCHPFDLDNGKQQELEKLCRGKCILWGYGAGIIHNGKWSPQRNRILTGADFGTTEISYAEMPSYKSVYVPKTTALTEADMRKIYRFAGVHNWTDASIPVYATQDLVAVHAGRDTQFELHLPRTCQKVTSLFDGQVWENVSEIHLAPKEPETWLLKMQ